MGIELSIFTLLNIWAPLSLTLIALSIMSVALLLTKTCNSVSTQLFLWVLLHLLCQILTELHQITHVILIERANINRI